MYVCIYVCMNVNICICVCMYVCMYVYIKFRNDKVLPSTLLVLKSHEFYQRF